MTEISNEPSERVMQGDIIRDVQFIERVFESEGVLEVAKVVFPAIIVLTQDCDLRWDHVFRTENRDTQDKWLISVLVAPLYNFEHFCAGEHLEEVGIRSQPIKKNKTPGRLLMQNTNPRYHYFEFPQTVPLVSSVIDFKHYFSTPVSYLASLKETNFVCSVSVPFREDISQRFAAFLSRIGLPELQAAPVGGGRSA